jgi:hypothetical protein
VIFGSLFIPFSHVLVLLLCHAEGAKFLTAKLCLPGGNDLKKHCGLRIFLKLPVAASISLFLIGTVYAMIRTLPIEDLVKKSDHIVIAYVYSVTTVSSDPSTKIIILRNELRLIESMKGAWPSHEPIILTTRRHEEHWIEDNVELPSPGTKVVLFLTKNHDRLVPVNGIQGVWPIKGNKLLQMGTGKTLDEIRAIVKRQEIMK